MARSQRKGRRLSAQDEPVGQVVCLQRAAVLNDKLHLLMTLSIRGRTHFRAKLASLGLPARKELWGGQGSSGTLRCLLQAQLWSVMHGGRREKVVPEILPVSSEVK